MRFLFSRIQAVEFIIMSSLLRPSEGRELFIHTPAVKILIISSAFDERIIRTANGVIFFLFPIVSRALYSGGVIFLLLKTIP